MIFNLDTQRYLARSPQTVLRWHERVRGMTGRRFTADMDAVVFPRCCAIHTLFVRMRTDVIFLDDENRVIAVRESLGRWRPFVWVSGSSTVLALPSGTICCSGTLAGHRIELNQELRPEVVVKLRYGTILYRDGVLEPCGPGIGKLRSAGCPAERHGFAGERAGAACGTGNNHPEAVGAGERRMDAADRAR